MIDVIISFSFCILFCVGVIIVIIIIVIIIIVIIISVCLRLATFQENLLSSSGKVEGVVSTIYRYPKDTKR